MDTTSKTKLAIMAAIAVVIGLVMAYIIPFMVQTSLERVLIHLQAHIAEGFPAFSSGLKLFDFFFSAWRALIFVAGAALITIAWEVKKGRNWTFPAAITFFAVPAIGGFFMFLPYVSWVPGFPLPMIISFIGLVGFWSFIALRDVPKMERLAQLGAFTFIGMMITHAFTIGVGAQRTMATRPGWPLYPGFTWWLFRWAGEVNWVAAFVLFISIPLLAMKKKSGWWLAVASVVAILMINVPTQFFRTKTLDYLYGSLLALGVLFFIIPPYFRQHLLALDAETAGADGDRVYDAT